MMGKQISFLRKLGLFLALALHGAVVVHGFLPPISSCSQLPHPQACYALRNPDPLFAGHKTGLDFRDFNVQGAVQRAQWAHLRAGSAMTAGKFDDPRTRAAWVDCMELAEETIDYLQSTMASPSCDETQTWLSAAIANQQTCLDGFSDFRIDLPLASLPFASSNISELISNSLAIDGAHLPSNGSSGGAGKRRLLAEGDLFPEWVSVGDRRLLKSSRVRANLVVAKDGSGNYKTIKEAIKAAKKKRSGSRRFVIYVKAGVYSENVEISKSMKNLMFIGDGIGRTIVTGKRSVKGGSTTFRSATFAVVGKGFIARDMTFQNTAGPENHQAVALRSNADFSVFYKCSFKGYQDTLYVHSQRQFYRQCDVYGTVDFIFGDAAVVFQNCNIYVRRPMRKQKNTVTAQGRSDPNENTGISIHNSRVTAASDLRRVQGSFKTYLGRPWKKYSRTVFMKCRLDGLIAPAGWLEWSGNFALNTLYYGEYRNTGAGASTSRRVRWRGFHVITSAAKAAKFTVGRFLGGNSWIPATKIPFTSGL